MSEPPLPLFPLASVLFPGLILPLHVFEPRYRVLVAELLERPVEDRRFGVVAIREGRDVGRDGVRSLYDVGCVAHLRQVSRHDDGRFDIVTVGDRRFRLHGLRPGRPYHLGEVELLTEDVGEHAEAPVLARAVSAAFIDYLRALVEAGADVGLPEPPVEDPQMLSYVVAATVLVDLPGRQALLEHPQATGRLRAELALLRRESTLLRSVAAVPAPELVHVPISPN